MSMQEPDFSYNPETGECDAPKQEGAGTIQWNTVVEQLRKNQQRGIPTGVHVGQPMVPPAQPGYAPPANQRGSGNHRRSRKDRMVTQIYELVRDKYGLVLTADSAKMLIDRATGTAYLLDPSIIAAEIQNLALHTAGVSVTRSEVKLALEAMMADAPEASDIPINAGQTMRGCNEMLYVSSTSGVVALGHYGQYEVPQVLPQRVGFFRMPNSKGPQFGMNGGVSNAAPLVALLDKLNVPEESRLLVIAWLVASLIPEANRVLMNITGERSSGRSTLQRVLKQLIDPSYAPLTQDIPTTSAKTYRLGEQDQVISLDNVTELTVKTQRALLELMSGRLIDVRTSSKSESAHMMLKHPVVLNSADSVVDWSDLADRSVLVRLPSLASIDRHFVDKLKRDSLLQASFSSLVWLLSHVDRQWIGFDGGECVSGLEHYCRIGQFVAQAMQCPKEAFDKQLEASLAYRFELELEEKPVVKALIDVLAISGEERLDLPVSELLARMNDFRPEEVKSAQWPNSARGLGNQLNDASGVMASYGIRVGPPVKKGGNGLIHRTVEKCEPTPYRKCHDGGTVSGWV